MLLVQTISSGTVVALSMSELLGVIAALLGFIGGIVVIVRKLERDDVRGDMRLSLVESRQVEQALATAEQARSQQTTTQQLLLLTKEVSILTKEVSTLTEALNQERRTNRSRTKQTAQ